MLSRSFPLQWQQSINKNIPTTHHWFAISDLIIPFFTAIAAWFSIDNSHLFSNFNKCIHTLIDFFFSMRRWYLYTNSGLFFRYDGIAEANHINAFFCRKTKKQNFYRLWSLVWNPSKLPSIWSAKSVANRASPSITGQIGWSIPPIVNPAAVIWSRKRFVLRWTFSEYCEEWISISITLIPLATTDGGNEFENKYGRERCFNNSISSLGPVV